jgi:hypothetical protein
VRYPYISLFAAIFFFSYLSWNAAQTTQPAPDSPADAVAEFRTGMDGVHPQNISQILWANDPEGLSKIVQLQKLANALARLRTAVNKQFGPKVFYLEEKPSQPTDVKIDGNLAVVTTADGRSVLLQHVGGVWRIPVKQEHGEMIQQHLAELQVMTEAINSIAADTEADRFDTADEVLRAAQEELTRGRAIRKATTAATTQAK